jgi:hypothetical protein
MLLLNLAIATIFGPAIPSSFASFFSIPIAVASTVSARSVAAEINELLRNCALRSQL